MQRKFFAQTVHRTKYVKTPVSDNEEPHHETFAQSSDPLFLKSQAVPPYPVWFASHLQSDQSPFAALIVKQSQSWGYSHLRLDLNWLAFLFYFCVFSAESHDKDKRYEHLSWDQNPHYRFH